jgi:hypothetical protein
MHSTFFTISSPSTISPHFFVAAAWSIDQRWSSSRAVKPDRAAHHRRTPWQDPPGHVVFQVSKNLVVVSSYRAPDEAPPVTCLVYHTHHQRHQMKCLSTNMLLDDDQPNAVYDDLWPASTEQSSSLLVCDLISINRCLLSWSSTYHISSYLDYMKI